MSERSPCVQSVAARSFKHSNNFNEPTAAPCTSTTHAAPRYFFFFLPGSAFFLSFASAAAFHAARMSL